MSTPYSVKKIFGGKSATFGFLAAAGCAALIFASGCGEVTTTPGQVAKTPSSGVKDDPPPAVKDDPAPTDGVPKIDPNDPDQGGYDSSFLWKPISDGDRNLVILTPYQMDFEHVTAGSEAGRYAGRNNGHRQHWRFSKPGAKYGKKVLVTAYGADGKIKTWIVPDGANRWTSR